MAEAIPYAAVAILVIGAWARGVAASRRLRAADARAWRRMTHLRGFATRGSTLRAGCPNAPRCSRACRPSSISNDCSLRRNSNETPAGFLARTGAIALMTFALLLAATAAGRALKAAGRRRHGLALADSGS